MGTNTKKHILLSVTMLVSNRPDTLEKCLISMQPLLNGISSELIIVDTAGDSACMKIVKRFTDNIVHFKWCDDFASARNAGLCKAKGEWVMYIDDDEWFEDISELMWFFQSGTYKEYRTASYITRNYSSRKKTSYNDRMAVRLSQRMPETKFIGRIHEQLEPLYEPTYYTEAYVHHYGYAFESQEELYEHSWRNIGLLTEVRAKEKDNWSAGAHLIQEYYAVKEFFSLIAVAKDVRSKKNCYEYGRDAFTAYAAVMEMQAYMDLKRYGDAYILGKELLAESRLLMIAHLFVSCMMPQVCLKCSDVKEAMEYCSKFWEYYAQWQEKKEECIAKDPFGLRDKFLKEDTFGFIYMIEMHGYIKMECWNKARDMFLKIKWGLLCSTLSNTLEDIVILIANTDYEEAYAYVLEILMKGKGTHQYLEEQIKKLDEDKKWKLLYAVSRISSVDVQFMQYKLKYSILCRDSNSVKKLLTQWKELNYSLFFPDKEYWSGLSEMNFELTPWMSETGIHEWIRLTEALYLHFSSEDCEKVYNVLSKGFVQTDIRMMHLMGLQLEKRLISCDINLENPDYLEMEEIWRELYRIASLWVGCASMLYQEKVFQGELQSALPPRYHFAWLIFQAGAVKNDTRSFVRKIAEAAKVYLAMNEVCRFILRCCKAEAEE